MGTSCKIVEVSSGVLPYNLQKPSYEFLFLFWDQHRNCSCYYCQQNQAYMYGEASGQHQMLVDTNQGPLQGQPTIKVNPKLLISDYPSLIANEKTDDIKGANVPKTSLFKCGRCGKGYKQQSRLKKHIATCQGKRPCGICGRILSTDKAEDDHMRNVHRNLSFPCHQCGKVFKSKTALSGHMRRTHTPYESQYPCTQCEKTFGCPKSLKRHMDIHDETKRWRCELCDVSFQSLYNMKRHNYTQHVRKTLRCRECGGFFDTVYDWWTHVDSHDKKKYQCAECPLSFNNHKNLKRHSLVHTTQKSFHCGLCDKSFKLKKSLEYHQMHRHQRVRLYTCHRCHKKFSRKSVLTSHLKTHSPKTFHCQLNNCAASFHVQYRLARHVALHHHEYYLQTRRLRAASTRDEYKMISSLTAVSSGPIGDAGRDNVSGGIGGSSGEMVGMSVGVNYTHLNTEYSPNKDHGCDDVQQLESAPQQPYSYTNFMSLHNMFSYTS